MLTYAAAAICSIRSHTSALREYTHRVAPTLQLAAVKYTDVCRRMLTYADVCWRMPQMAAAASGVDEGALEGRLLCGRRGGGGMWGDAGMFGEILKTRQFEPLKRARHVLRQAYADVC